jgi:hypothetical protein
VKRKGRKPHDAHPKHHPYSYREYKAFNPSKSYF